MTDADAPPWDLLPHDPLGFFGLEPDFEPLELRRRYGRLIKRYKPERDPEAFKRVRAAYEALGGAGLAAAAPAPVLAPGARDVAAPIGAGAATPRAMPATRALEVLAASGVQAARESLGDELRLETAGAEAMLMRACLAANDEELLTRLVDLLRARPAELRAARLLSALLAWQVPVDQLERLLARVRRGLGEGAWAVSVGGWARLLRIDHVRFGRAWMAIDDDDSAARAWVLLELLPAAGLRLGLTWIQRAGADLDIGRARAAEVVIDTARFTAEHAETAHLLRARHGRLGQLLDDAIVALADDDPDAMARVSRLLSLVSVDPAREAARHACVDPALQRAVLALEVLLGWWRARGRLADPVADHELSSGTLRDLSALDGRAIARWNRAVHTVLGVAAVIGALAHVVDQRWFNVLGLGFVALVAFVASTLHDLVRIVVVEVLATGHTKANQRLRALARAGLDERALRRVFAAEGLQLGFPLDDPMLRLAMLAGRFAHA